MKNENPINIMLLNSEKKTNIANFLLVNHDAAQIVFDDRLNVNNVEKI